MNDLQKGSLSLTRRNGVPPGRSSPVISFFTPSSAESLFCLAIPAPCLVRPAAFAAGHLSVSSEEVRKMKRRKDLPTQSATTDNPIISWKGIQKCSKSSFVPSFSDYKTESYRHRKEPSWYFSCLDIWVEKRLCLECDVLITKVRGGVGTKLLAPNPPSSIKKLQLNSLPRVLLTKYSTEHFIFLVMFSLCLSSLSSAADAPISANLVFIARNKAAGGRKKHNSTPDRQQKS